MVKLLSSAVTSILLLSSVSASPVRENEQAELQIDTLLGFDPSFPQIMDTNAKIPETKTFSIEDFAGVTTSQLEPFIPDGVEVGDEASAIEKRFIEGKDDRFQFTSDKFPFRAVGKIQWSNGVYCSGALVGPRHVLTARHCLISGATATFSARYDNGAHLGQAGVSAIVHAAETGGECDIKNDWGILVINKRLGDSNGYFGVKLADKNKIGNVGFNHTAYPGDRSNGQRPFRQNNNKVITRGAWSCDSLGPFSTNTDTAGGQSGGPFWETVGTKSYIWGALSIGVTDGTSSWAKWGSGDLMVAVVERMKADFP